MIMNFFSFYSLKANSKGEYGSEKKKIANSNFLPNPEKIYSFFN